MVDKMFHALLLSPTLMVNNVYKSREKWHQNGFQTILVDGSNTRVNTFMHKFYISYFACTLHGMHNYLELVVIKIKFCRQH